jgi:hypothetical protein
MNIEPKIRDCVTPNMGAAMHYFNIGSELRRPVSPATNKAGVAEPRHRKSVIAPRPLHLVESFLSQTNEMRSTIYILKNSTTEGVNDGYFIF